MYLFRVINTLNQHLTIYIEVAAGNRFMDILKMSKSTRETIELNLQAKPLI